MSAKKKRTRKKRVYLRRWHAPTPGRTPASEKTYIKAAELRVLLTKALGKKLADQYTMRFADGSYFCPPLSEAKKIIKASRLDKKTWVEERFDCDDFAHVLKAHFAEAAYKNGKRRAAHCFGVVWGSLPTAHAINWMVTDDLKLRFVEPQSDAIYSPKSTDKDIYFMLV